MRVSDTSLFKQFLIGIRAGRRETEEALRQFADGKRVRYSSDDPGGARTTLELRGRLVRSEGYKRSAGAARYDLATLDTVVGEAFDLLSQARVKALAGANGTGEQANDVLAVEIDQFRERLLDLANTTQNGRYLFAGTATLDPAFDAAGAYAGSNAEVQAPIDTGASVGATLDGGRVFLDGGDVFQTLDDLATALRNDDYDTIRNLIPELNDEMQNVNQIHTEIGTRMQLIDRTLNAIGDEQVRLQERIISIEDVDPAEATLRLASANTSLEALSLAGARTLGRSLFDYLG